MGTYSEGNLLVVYEINKQVFPTAPSPTTTHLIVCIFDFKTRENQKARFWGHGFDYAKLSFLHALIGDRDYNYTLILIDLL